MDQGVNFERPSERLYRDVPLRHTASLAVLGVPVRFETNSPTVLEVIEEAFGAWRALEGRFDLLADQSVRVRLIVHDVPPAALERLPFTYRVPDPDRRLILAPGTVAVGELRQREAWAYLNPALVADRAHFRYGVVEALTLMMVTPWDRHPVHAAAIARDGVALLLAGPSGVGKSSLAYVAARAGLRVVSDDVVYLQLAPDFRVWGSCPRLHLPEDAAERFPELEPNAATFLANGKRKVAVPVPGNHDQGPMPVSGRVSVCLVRRGAGPPRLERMSPEAVLAALGDDMASEGFDVFASAIGPRLSRLAEAGGWRLTLGGDPAQEVRMLQVALDELASRR